MLPSALLASRLRRSSLLIGVVLLAACAGFGPRNLPPGSSRAQVMQTMGIPTAEHTLRVPSLDRAELRVDTTDAAVRRLEYNGGTFGRSTYMLDFDFQDRLLASAQVRAESRFNAILAGMSQQDLLRVLGRPSNIRGLSFQKQNVWAYRYDSPFCQWFQVGVGYDGKVVDTAYGPDPLCDDDGPFHLMGGRRGRF